MCIHVEIINQWSELIVFIESSFIFSKRKEPLISGLDDFG